MATTERLTGTSEVPKDDRLKARVLDENEIAELEAEKRRQDEEDKK